MKGQQLLFLIITLFLFIALSPAWTASAGEIFVVVTSYDYSTDPPCGTSLTSNCVEGFEFFKLEADSPEVVLGFCGVAFNADGTPLTTNIGCPLQGIQPPYGRQDVFARVVGKDDGGARIASAVTGPYPLTVRPTSIGDAIEDR